jgi:putative glycosyltransferase (TIGR04372 family)
MKWRRLRSGWFLLWCYLVGTLRGVVREMARGPRALWRELRRCAVRTYCATRFAVQYLRGRTNLEPLVRLCRQTLDNPDRLFDNPDTAFFLARRLLARQKYEKVIEALTPLGEPLADWGKCLGVRGMAHLQLGEYAAALADLTQCHEIQPVMSQQCAYNYQRAFLLGLRGEPEAARAAVRDQLGLASRRAADKELARFLYTRVKPLFANRSLRGSVGVFLGMYPQALGHAILDPFHYFNLFRHRFDNLLMIHPDLNGYSPATRLTMSTLEAYVETAMCTDHDVLNFAWQNLGELQHDQCTFLVYNYWALNRQACKARQDPAHVMHRRREYFRPPPKIIMRAEALLAKNRIDPDRPLVVVHSRESGYHQLRGQSYRDTSAHNYIPALRKLIAQGYQVVRIGDRKMVSLSKEVPGLVELPLTDFYTPVLDPYFIWRCRFMISCQSGPCSYARVFGKPNLVVNAVYHYTLLPEHNELIAFKNYRNAVTKQSLSVEEIFQAGAHLFDRTHHFAEANIETEDMTPEEIEASVDEMLAWLDRPKLAETPAQREFRRLMTYFARRKAASPLATPMTDYIGYALPECRIADAVVALRPGYLSAARKLARSA